MGEITKRRLAEHAEKIRELGKRALRDIIEVGRHLTEAKLLVGHGAWLPWIQKEFGWSEMTATRFMRIFDFERELKSHNLLDLSLNLSALYELTRRRTPPEVVTHFIAKAARGEKVKASEIKEASARVLPFPKREPPPAPSFPPVVPPLEVTHHEVPLAVVTPGRDSPPSTDWNLFHQLANAASCIHDVAGTPDLDGAIKGLIDRGRLRDVIRAAEAFAKAGALAERLLAVIAAAAKAEPSSDAK